jgi:ATP-dependent phosphoenolpyruvate carboxykinase
MSVNSLNVSLSQQGFPEVATIFANLGTAPLIEHAVRHGEGLLAKDGPFVVATASTLAVRPRTSSSSATMRPKAPCGGARPTWR